MDAAGKAERLRFALRGVELDEREERIIGWAGQMWDQDAMEIVCSLLEKVREAGFLSRGADEYVRKPPGEWGSLSSVAGATYTGGENPVGPMPQLDTP